MSERVDKIRRCLINTLSPQLLEITDDSHQHRGHAGAHEGGSHFSVVIVAPAFTGHDTITRHRLVYDALGDMMQSEIHALRITAKTPDES